jgi:PAS domain S-box-containing protein
MKQNRAVSKPVSASAKLRRRAEDHLRKQPAASENVSPDQVHQIELEMQNEELRRAQHELEQRVADRTLELEKTEAQQRTCADDLKAILETVTDGISVTDAHGNFTAMNSVFVRLYGYARKEDLLGMPAIETVAERDRTRAFEYLRQMLLVGPVSSCEYQMVRRDGSEFLGEVNVTPINDESNYPTRFVAITRDITKRKAAEQALRTSQEYARNIIDSSLDMIIAVDMGRRITEFNKAAEEIFEYRREQVLGESIDLLYADSVESESVHARTVLKGRNVSQILNKSKTGRVFPSLLSASVLRDPHGTPIGFMGISRDITELKRAQEEQTRLFDQVRAGRERLKLLSKQLLDAQESERRHIARELHDEIGQAMTGVQMNLQIIEPLLTDASAKTRLEDTALAIERMLQQIRNLSLDLRPSLLDDFGLIPALRWLLERQAQRTGLDIEFTADPLEKRAPEQIETVCFRVTQEAITNITRHAHARHVSVRLSGSQSDVELTIQDDGIGFDVTQAVEHATQGNSMGLLGMQERVILVGGKAEISSAPNQGTRIQVTIPFNGSTAYKDRRSKRRTDNETNPHFVS